MRILIILLVCVLAGLGALGGWLVLGPELSSFIGSKSEKTSEAPDEAPVRDKRRYAPYVVLVPSTTLPDQSAEQAPDKPAAETARPAEAQAPAPQPDTIDTPRSLAASPAKEPVKEKTGKRQSASLSIAQQALEAVQDPDTGRKPDPAPEPAKAETVKPDPEPRKQPETSTTSEQKPATQVAPAPKAPPRAESPTAAKEAPANQEPVRTAKRGATKLKYEREVARQSEEKAQQTGLVAEQNVRFRKVIPVSPGKLKAGENFIVLAGIEALGAEATCPYETGRSWDCGRWGTFSLRRLIRARSVVCDLTEKTSQNEAIGKCTVGRTEINRWVVRRGWALPTAATEEEYADDLEQAKKGKLGQWSQDPKSNL